MIINSGENIWSISKETTEVFAMPNHEEAETRLIFLEEISNDAAVIVA